MSVDNERVAVLKAGIVLRIYTQNGQGGEIPHPKETTKDHDYQGTLIKIYRCWYKKIGKKFLTPAPQKS